jgi:hypothetical protein
MRHVSALISFGLALMFSATVASAQNFTVQQPVFSNFSVGTTVSVPDRGGAYLGGVSRAGSSRRSFGPLRSGSSFGLFRDHSGLSSHVTIHDMHEMDRLLLGQADRGSVERYGTTRSGPSARAYSSLVGRHGARHASVKPGRTSASSPLPSSPVTRADRSFRLGQQAEAKGKTSLARLHFRMAAKHGSTSAQAKLASLGGRSRIATTGGLK